MTAASRLAASSGLLAALVVASACGSSGSSSDQPTDPGTSGGPPASTSSSANPPGPAPGTDGGPAAAVKLKTVFLILMENNSWGTIKNSASAKYINGTLVPMGAHAEHYSTPPSNHPSEPNYIWLEAGDNLGITNDDDPGNNHKSTKDHLTSQLEGKGIAWKAYSEDISGTACPLVSSGLFGTKHTPQLFFDDVTDTNTSSSKHCIDHVRPYTELAGDLSSGSVARYNFITPNLCNDMHGEVGSHCPYGVTDLIKRGDDWLAAEVPKILASKAYQDGGMLVVLWDEGDEPVSGPASDGPIGCIVVSPLAKKGYTSNTSYTHSSMLRTVETIFGVPFLRGAQTSNDLSDMFTSFP